MSKNKELSLFVSDSLTLAVVRYHGEMSGLLAQRDVINPLALRRKIYNDLQHLFAYPCAAQGESQDVFQTLAYPELFPEAMAALEDDSSDADQTTESLSIVKEDCLVIRTYYHLT